MNTTFLTDSKGKKSHARLLVMLCVPVLVLVPIIVWGHMAWKSTTPIGIDPTIPLYIAAANGIILGYAGYKSKGETKETDTKPSP